MAKVEGFQRFQTRGGSMCVYLMSGSELGQTGQYELARFSDDPNAPAQYPIGAEITVTPDLWELASNQRDPQIPRYVLKRGRGNAATPAAPAPDVAALESKFAALARQVSILTAILVEIADRSERANKPLPPDLVDAIRAPRKDGEGEIPF